MTGEGKAVRLITKFTYLLVISDILSQIKNGFCIFVCLPADAVRRTRIISMKRMNKHPRQANHLGLFACFFFGRPSWSDGGPRSLLLSKDLVQLICVHVYIRGQASQPAGQLFYSHHVLAAIYGKEYANGGQGFWNDGKRARGRAGPFIQLSFFFLPQMKKPVEKLYTRRRFFFPFFFIFTFHIFFCSCCVF